MSVAKSDKKVKYLIIGAGPTGLGAAHRLKNLGEMDFLVIDKSSHAGGLASSFKDEAGFTWDIGGHVQFSHYDLFDEVMSEALGEDGWLNHERESWVWMKNRFIPYPLQNNIRFLPKEDMWSCLKGLINIYKTPPMGKPSNFEEWILATFGKGLADVFMLPYNFKVWAYPPQMMGYTWIGERVAVTDLSRVTENILFEKDDLSWGPNNTFKFPKNGGTGAIWTAVAHQIGLKHFMFGENVVGVNHEKKLIQLASGEKIFYDSLLSTMPLDILTRLIENIPGEIKELAQGLRHSSSNIVGVGLKGRPREELAKKCWMYFPEDNCPFYRVTVFSNYSPNNVPDHKTQWSLMTETSQSTHKHVNQESLIRDTVEGLIATKMIDSAEDVISTWHYHAGYGYPTPSSDRDEILKGTLPYLDQMGLFSRGRFGAWKYEVSNQDHSFMQGVEWVNRIKLGVPETTLFFPSTANAMWGRS